MVDSYQQHNPVLDPSDTAHPSICYPYRYGGSVVDLSCGLPFVHVLLTISLCSSLARRQCWVLSDWRSFLILLSLFQLLFITVSSCLASTLSFFNFFNHSAFSLCKSKMSLPHMSLQNCWPFLASGLTSLTLLDFHSFIPYFELVGIVCLLDIDKSFVYSFSINFADLAWKLCLSFSITTLSPFCSVSSSPTWCIFPSF